MLKLSLIIILFSISYSYCQIIKPISARAFSMGQSSSFSTNDVDIYNNPSMIAELKNCLSSVSYANQFNDDYAIGINIAVPSKIGIIGILFHRWEQGGFEKTNEYGIRTGTFSFIVSYYSLSYSNKIIDNFYFGINTNLIHEKIDTDSEFYNPGFDISTYYSFFLSNKFLKNIKSGILIKNINEPSIKFGTHKDFLYREYVFINENNFRLLDQSIQTVINISYYDNQNFKDQYRYNLGLEYALSWIQLRIGYYSDSIYSVGHNTESGVGLFSYGFGLKFSNYYLDYGFGKYTDDYASFDPIHKITLGIGFNL